MPGNTVVINGSPELTFYVGDSKMEILLTFLEAIGCLEDGENVSVGRLLDQLPTEAECITEHGAAEVRQAREACEAAGRIHYERIAVSPRGDLIDATARWLAFLEERNKVPEELMPPKLLYQILLDVSEILECTQAFCKALTFLHDRYLKKS